jgi:hypothetical protein
MEKVLLGVFVLLLVLFIGNVAYKEAFADCSTPGQMTWTITLGPGSSSCSADGGSSGSGSGGGGGGGGSGGGSGRGTGRTYLDASGGRLADSVGRLGTSSGSGSNSSSTTNTSNTTQKKSMIELSLSDLLALIGSTKDNSGNRAPSYNYRYASMSIPQPPAPPAPQIYVLAGQPAASLNTQFTSDLRTAAPIDLNAGYQVSPTYQAIPASSYALRQGLNYVRGAPQNNPAENPEYIRKDSIPCYACSL